MSRWLICGGLLAAILSQGTVQAEPAYCPAIKLDDGASIQLYAVTYEGRDDAKTYFAFWKAFEPFKLSLSARFDVSGRPITAPNRLQMTVFSNPISQFGAEASNLDLVLKVQGAQPWRSKLPPANPPMPGSASDAFVDATDRPDLMSDFMNARTASLSVVSKTGRVLETASFNLPSPADWRALKEGVASTLARSRSAQPCRLSEMRVLADGIEAIIHHGPPPPPTRSPPPQP